MWNNIKILGKYSVTGYLGTLEKGRIIYVDGKTEERDLQDENKINEEQKLFFKDIYDRVMDITKEIIREAKPHNIL